MTDEPNKTDTASPKEKGSDDDWSLFGKVRSDVLKKKLESVLKKDGVLKSLVSELRLPREIIAHMISQIDETKHAALGVVSREVRTFFENTNLADEMAKLLSQVSFEVSTRVRFVRNDPDEKQETKKQTSKKDVPGSHAECLPTSTDTTERNDPTEADGSSES
jgi:hypothetical protein